jgi:tetratricopeptide (TPR) repeat protein
LNVDTIVEGSVQRVDGKVIVTAQLIRAANDEHIWGDRFERKTADILILQNEIARTIADHIRIKFTAQDEARLTTQQIVNPAAYEAYLKGAFLRHKWQLGPAVEQFQEAMRIQPDYAQAYGGLALTYMLAPGLVGLTNLQARAKAQAAAERALELDEKVADAHFALASIRGLIDYDWPAWEREIKYAIGLNPGLAEGYFQYGMLLGMIGRIDEGVVQLKRAREMDPLSADINGGLGRLYYYAQRYPEAVQRLTEALRADPDQWIGRVFLAGTYAQQGKYAEAQAEAAKLPDWFPEKRGSLAYLSALSGQREKALSELSALVVGGKGSPVSPWTIAGIYTALGDKDQAFVWLEKAYETRFIILPSLSVSPVFAPLRQDPRFAALLKKMNLDPATRRPRA